MSRHFLASRLRLTRLGLAAIAATSLVLSLSTWADNHKSPQLIAAYAQECSGCHIAYNPQWLPKASWKRIMGKLDKHYGSDASLDTATLLQIDTWLQANAGQDRRASKEPPEDRITRSDWFIRKHREVAPDTFRRASIKSAANCVACHSGAAKGDFDEDRIKIPK